MRSFLGFLVHSPLSYYARVTPEHPAMACQGDWLSYRQLDEASNRLARALRDNGVEKSDRVGILLPKRLEIGIAIYGILKAGAVFVPLDPFISAERLDFIVQDCGIEHLVSADQLSSVLSELSCTPRPFIYGVDANTLESPSLGWDDIGGLSSQPVELDLVDLDLAYLMYTSGSTGQPKGMMHTHRGSVSYARWGALHVDLGAQDRVASHAPLHFDLSVFDFFSTAQAGGTVVLVPEAVTKLPASWTSYIESERISVVFTVPFTLLQMFERGAMDKRDLSSLRWILFGGEPFSRQALRALMEVLPRVAFTNVYGPAEAPSCTYYDVPPLAADDEQPLPIGEVSLNSEGIIIDEEERECEPGVEGELCIRSSTLTLGYWNRPDLNARAFLRRPNHGPFPEIWYRTGDIVVRDREDGLLRFLGRKDRMIKTRGNRVELDEVEIALESHPEVAEAAAYAVPDGEGSNKILAAAVLQPGSDASAALVLRHVRTRLPAYALPREIEILEHMPRTSTGKIDRRHLAERANGN